MTKEQEREMLQTGGVTTLSRPCSLPLGVSHVAPTPHDEMAHAKLIKDLDPSKFNQMSVDDAEALHSLRQMDRLHQQDAAAAHFYEGKKIQNQYEHGTDAESTQKRNALVQLIKNSKKK